MGKRRRSFKNRQIYTRFKDETNKRTKKWEEINPNYLENEQLLNEWQTLVIKLWETRMMKIEKNNQLIKKISPTIYP